MGRLSSGGDELGKTLNVYNVKYVKSLFNAGYCKLPLSSLSSTSQIGQTTIP